MYHIYWGNEINQGTDTLFNFHSNIFQNLPQEGLCYMGLYGHDIYISFFFVGGLIYSMLNFCLEDFVLFLFVLLNKQTIWTWTILKYKLCIICISYVTEHILRPKVKSRCSFEVWIILSLRNKYLQVILHDTVWFRHDVQSSSLCTTHGVSKLFIN